MVSETTSKPRITWIDTAKGICILLVVLQHTSNFTHMAYPLRNDFLTFRMPLYFILSGLFFKPYDGFIGFAKRKVNKLLIPYIFFFSVGGVFLPVVLFHLFGIRIWSYKDYGFEAFSHIFSEDYICNPSIWFLVCLFEVNLFFYAIIIIAMRCKEKNMYNIVVILLSILLGFGGLAMSYLHINLPYFVDSALSTLPFFCFGWYLRNNTSFLYREKNLKRVILAIILIFIWMIFLHFNNHGHLSIMSNYYGKKWGFIELYPYGMIGTICVLSMSKIMGNIPLISYIGRYSIIVLCTHAYVIQFAGYLSTSFMRESNLYIVFILTVIIQMLVIPIFIKYLGYFTAQKDIIKID